MLISNSYRYFIATAIFLCSICLSIVAHADNDQPTSIIQDKLVYTLVQRKFVSENDVAFAQLAPKQIDIFAPVYSDKHDPHKGILITTIQQYYDPQQVNRPRDLGLYIDETCLDNIKIHECNTQNGSIESLYDQPLDPQIFTEQDQQWMQANYPHLALNQEVQYSFKYINNRPVNLALNLQGTLHHGESENYGALITSYYVSKKQPFFFDYLNSSHHITLFKGLTLLLIIATLAYMMVLRREWAVRNTFGAGVGLIALGVINAMLWDVHYMVIGTGLIAVAGVFLLFGNGFGKLIYLAGAFLIALMASFKFGVNTRQFFAQMALLFTIGLLITFLEENYIYQKNDDDDDEHTRTMSDEELRKYAKIRERRIDVESINPEKSKLLMQRFALALFLLMVIIMAIEVIL